MTPLAAAMQTRWRRSRSARLRQYRHPEPVHVCTDPRRDGGIIVVVGRCRRLWALEARALAVNFPLSRAGRHALAARRYRPAGSHDDALCRGAHDPAVTEVILALNATVDGQTTAHYITDLLHDANVKVTAVGARRAGRRRARLPRRGHALGRDQAADDVLD